MTVVDTSPAQRSRPVAVLLLLATLTLTATLLSRAVINDDPYITYRYARNLASGVGFVYNAGEPVLSTSAPLYALLLAALALFKIDPPVASLIVGSIATFTGSALLYRLGLRSRHAAPAAIGAVLLATSPLVWMATGMESSLYLALALGAFNATADRRWRIAGLLAACAALVRGDGLLVMGLIGLAEFVERQRIPWRSTLTAAALILPAVIVATAAYGSPFPATLRAKVQQASLGITGFFPGARFPDGIARLAAAYFEQSWLYILALPLIALGLAQSRAQRWAWLILAWGALQMIGYTALGVAPYRWYYIPLLPALCLLVGLGIAAIAQPAPHRLRSALTLSLACIMLTAQARSIWEIHRSTDPSIPRSELIGIDALPETSALIYRQVGTWLRDHSPSDSSVGVMEVGVIGYTAERRMIDYLGLLQPEVAAALGRRDIYWSIPHTLPDYLVLTSINPLYNYDLLADAWFQATYAPAAQFDDPRFWGSPITIYQRRAPAVELIPQPIDQTVGALRLTGYAAEPISIHPGTPIRIRLDWAKPATPLARVSVNLIGPQGRVIATHSRTIETEFWPASGGSVYHTIVTGPDTPPGLYRAYIEVESDDGSGQTTLGAWKSPLAAINLPPELTPRAIRFGDAIDVLGYTLEPVRPLSGDEVHLTLYWRSWQPVHVDYTVFVHVENSDGRLILAADSQPRLGDYPTSIWSPGEVIDDRHTFQLPGDLAAGTYPVRIGLYVPDSGERLAVDGSDQVRLATISIRKP